MNPSRIKFTSSLLIGILFFLVYSFLNLTAPLRFNSPDENANHFFTKNFVETGGMYSFDSLNLAAPGLVHPRSIRVVGDFLVPGGFIGLPVIYGAVAKVLGLGVAPFLTAFFAVLAAAALASVVGKYFGRTAGWSAGLLLLVNPAWWYESSRPFMPNSLFVTLVMLSAWFMLAAPLAAARCGRPRCRWDVVWRADGAIAGLIFGLALAVRLSEIYWLALAVAALAVVSWRKLPWSRLILFVFFAAVMLLPFLGLNRSLYGSWTGTGYGPGLGGVPVEELPAGRGAQLLGGLQPYLFPLGFAPRTALANFLTYGIGFFWWWSALVAAALVIIVHAAVRGWRRRQSPDRACLAFAAAAGLTAAWLVFFYGSWSIHDNPDPKAVTIGSSYLRYWLPLFVLSVVPVAWALQAVSERLSGRFRTVFLSVFFILLAAASGWTVLNAPAEGLLVMRANLIRYDREIGQVLALTDPKALIVVDRADKLFFPDRRVIYPLRSEVTYAALPKLIGRAPLYYYGITFPEKDFEFLRAEKLPPLGLTIEKVLQLQDESLYFLRPSAPAPHP